MKRIFKYIDKKILIISTILFSLGLVMVFSASNVTAYMSHEVSPYNYFIKQSIFLLSGVILSYIMLHFSTKSYGKFSKILTIIFNVLLLMVLVIGEEQNQARSWLKIGPLALQPSEFMKIISIVWLAYYFDRKKITDDDSYIKNIYPLIICLIPAALTFLQPDLGTTIIYILIIALMFSALPIKKEIKTKIVFAGLAMIAMVGIILVSSGKDLIKKRQLERFDFFRPCDKLLTTGSQVCNGYIAINNGGLKGTGLGNSTQKYLYLAEPYTDFIYAIIIEELGLIVGIGIIIAYIVLLYEILKIGRKSFTTRGALICYGVAGYIFIHIAVNLTGMFGLFILTGVPLPFMSYGGSFTWSLIGALTLVQRVNIENKLMEEGEMKCQ